MYPASPMYPGAPGTEPPKPKTLTELADEAFRKGRDRQGFQLLAAAAIVDPEASEHLPDDFRYVPYLKKPAMSVRWGIGVTYNPSKGYIGHPAPIGYSPPAPANNTPGTTTPSPNNNNQQQPRRKVFGQPRMNQQNQQYPSTQPGQNNQPQVSHPPGDPAEFLEYYTGEFGEKVVEIIKKHCASGDFGEAQRRALEAFESGPPPVANNNGQPGYPTPVMMSPMNPMGQQEKKPETFKVGGILPGVVVLGEGSERELLDVADDQRVDFVVIFDVSVRKSKESGSNTTKVRVMSLDRAKLPANAGGDQAKARELFVSTPINSHRVEAAREKREADPLEAEMQNFAAALDNELKTQPLKDKVTEATALKRATFLVAQEVDNPLQNLAEVRCYHALELVSDEQCAELFAKVLGPDKAAKLVSGKTEADRAAVLAKWIPKPEKDSPPPR
jgi:hypothetical protein